MTDYTLGSITLKPAQAKALQLLKVGSILAGGVGSGKTYISIFWAAHNARGRHIYVITEAVKRDKVEQGHIKPDWQESFEKCGFSDDEYTVDSWNNIKKYKHVKDALFLFDEQHAISYNPYSKTSWGTLFVGICLNNKWILASATPGDEWINYLPVFMANRFFRTKSEFIKNYVIYDQYAKFPKIKQYVNTAVLDRLRKKILVPVEVERHTIRIRHNIVTKYDKDAYKHIVDTRFNEETQEPFATPGEFASALRKVSNTAADRVNKAYEVMFGNRRIIVFYRYNYERDIIINIAKDLNKPWAEWSGHAHQPIPNTDDWTYICQYSAASKAWSCIATDAMLFYSVTGTYNTMEQSEGRIDRLNTPYTDLHYYYLHSSSPLDSKTMQSLKSGKDFNENAWIKRNFGGFEKQKYYQKEQLDD